MICQPCSNSGFKLTGTEIYYYYEVLEVGNFEKKYIMRCSAHRIYGHTNGHKVKEISKEELDTIQLLES